MKSLPLKRIIFFIGPRAAGKSTIGGIVARRLGFAFADSDAILQETWGQSVEEIVAAEGWPGFRLRENRILRKVAAPETVVAAGGGSILIPANRRFMKAHGFVIYLKAPAAVLIKRLRNNPVHSLRPSLTGRPMHEEVSAVLAEREEFYQQAAHLVIDAAPGIEEVAANAFNAVKAALEVKD